MAGVSAAQTKLKPALSSRLQALVVRNRFCVSILLLLVSIGHVALFSAVNLSSGELKARGTFISENAIAAGLFNQGFDRAKVALAHDAAARFAASSPSTSLAAATFFRDELRALGTEADIQAYVVRRGRFDVQAAPASGHPAAASPIGGRAGAATPATAAAAAGVSASSEAVELRYNVYAVLRARGDTLAQDSVFFGSTYPTVAEQARAPVRTRAARQEAPGSDAQAQAPAPASPKQGVPHSAFLLLALVARLKEAPWRGKDTVIVLTGDEAAAEALAGCTEQGVPALLAQGRSLALGCASATTAAPPVSSPGLEAWLRMWHFDLLEEARLKLQGQALTSLSPASWWRMVQVEADAWGPQATALLQQALNESTASAWPSWARPPAFTAGPIRGGAFVSVTPSLRPPVSSLVLAVGARSLVPDLDMFTLAEKCWSLGYPLDVVGPGMVLPAVKGVGGGSKSGGAGGQHDDTSASSPSSSSPLRPGMQPSSASKGKGGSRKQQGGYGDILESVYLSTRSAIRRNRGRIDSVLRSVTSPLAQAGMPLYLAAGDLERWLDRLNTLLRFGWGQLWGAAGPHGPLLPANKQSVTLSAVYPAFPPESKEEASEQDIGSAVEAAVRMGKGLEKLARALIGLDERMHASPPFYLLMSSIQFVGLTEYAICTGMAYLPLLLLVLSDLPTPQGAVYGIATVALSILFGLGAYWSLLNERLLGLLHASLDGVVGPYLPAASSPAIVAAVAWALAVAVVELCFAAGVWPAWAALWRVLLPPPPAEPAPTAPAGQMEQTGVGAPGAAGAHAVVAPVQPKASVGTKDAWVFAWLLMGYTAFPLLYLNWPLLMAASWTLLPLLVVYGWLLQAGEGKGKGAAAAAGGVGTSSSSGQLQPGPLSFLSSPSNHATILWLLASPANILLHVVILGPETAGWWADGLATARQLHVQDGSLILPVLTLVVLPAHLALMARQVRP